MLGMLIILPSQNMDSLTIYLQNNVPFLNTPMRIFIQKTSYSIVSNLKNFFQQNSKTVFRTIPSTCNVLKTEIYTPSKSLTLAVVAFPKVPFKFKKTQFNKIPEQLFEQFH